MIKYKIIKDCDGNLLYKKIIEDPLDMYRLPQDSIKETKTEKEKDVPPVDDFIGVKRCHACKKVYNELYEAEKYETWNDYVRREHHWSECEKVKERRHSYISTLYSVCKDNIFDTTTLSVDVRYKILNSFEAQYMSVKHIYNECQPRYIDNVTTAYQSDIMRGIMSHED